jgi:hypothetical protein
MVTSRPEIVNKPFYLRTATLTGMQEASWYDIPAVQILGAILGSLLLIAAIRSMFGKKR